MTLHIENALSDFKDFGHSSLDSLSLAYHIFAAFKLKANPCLLARLQERNNASMQNLAIRSSYPYFKKWAEIIDEGIESVVSTCLERSDHGQVMRSCSPVVAIISQSERTQIMEIWQQKHGGKLLGATLENQNQND